MVRTAPFFRNTQRASSADKDANTVDDDAKHAGQHGEPMCTKLKQGIKTDGGKTMKHSVDLRA
jgi:hypothetical protein